jgi:hypothetical protein
MKNIFLFIFLLPAFGFAQEAKISGVVTYFFNKYQGYKPDIGAKVLLFDSTFEQYFNSWDTLNKVKSYKSLYLSNMDLVINYQNLAISVKNNKKRKEDYDRYLNDANTFKVSADEYKKKLDDIGFSTEEQILELNKRLFVDFNSLKNKALSEKTVDGNGTYVFDRVNPGRYFLWLTSLGRTGSNLFDLLGTNHIRKVNLSNSDVTVSQKFEAN